MVVLERIDLSSTCLVHKTTIPFALAFVINQTDLIHWLSCDLTSLTSLCTTFLQDHHHDFILIRDVFVH